ncbi:hypothetical protein Tco_1016303 [Tanacetum coccineum]|uniref:Uncharacterized protein n=1 Tax=Tanacetum coccineum TaxID=301880 RepID=A0ABQ5FPG6_9ASTR
MAFRSSNRDGNEHVQRMLHVICVINNKKGLKEDSRCGRGEGRVFGNGLEHKREPWKRLGSRSSSEYRECMSKGGSGGGCGIYDDCELLLTELCR